MSTSQAPRALPIGRWPALSFEPARSLRTAFVRWALMSAFPRFVGDVRVAFPDGTMLHSKDATENGPVMTIVDEDRFFGRSAVAGKVGFGESYMAQEWVADDLPGVLSAWARNIERLPVSFNRLGHLFRGARARRSDANTRSGSRRNISHHYDLSNEMFELFLDDSLTYSSAVFKEGDTFEQAQERKRSLLLEPLNLGPSTHLLEIGTGWGAMAIHAAEHYGTKVTTVTISQEQHDFAVKLAAEKGLDHLIDVQLLDYRDVDGSYDAIVSVEMFEAVGREFWQGFFGKMRAVLNEGGKIALQTITMPHRRWVATRGGYGWIHKYIFPGGEIPSLQALQRPIHGADLEVVAHREIGPHYVDTLRLWRERFMANTDKVTALGFDDVFVRMWEFYLAYCEAGFATGALGDSQLVLAPKGT